MMNSDYLTPDEILKSASVPAKASVLRKEIFCDAENHEYSVEFMLSGDFIEFNSHAEPAMCHQYEPFSDEDFTEYDSHLPYFMLTPDLPEYPEVVGEPVKIGRAIFRVKFPYDHKQVMMFYFFEPFTVISTNGLAGMAMVYHQDIKNSPLEEKLLSALEEAVRTYKEIKLD